MSAPPDAPQDPRYFDSSGALVVFGLTIPHVAGVWRLEGSDADNVWCMECCYLSGAWFIEASKGPKRFLRRSQDIQEALLAICVDFRMLPPEWPVGTPLSGTPFWRVGSWVYLPDLLEFGARPFRGVGEDALRHGVETELQDFRENLLEQVRQLVASHTEIMRQLARTTHQARYLASLQEGDPLPRGYYGRF